MRLFCACALIVLATFTVSLNTIADGLNANEGGQIIAGKTRFTVITPELIRIEYNDKSQFTDQPSIFAVNRDVRDTEFKYYKNGNKIQIETRHFQLTYTDDGKPLSASNLQIAVNDTTWTPGMKNKQNLGGTRQSLDHVKGFDKIDDGLLAKDGWFLLDDSQRFLFTDDGWVTQRAQTAGTDWYFFAYGNDYKGALKSLTAISGKVPLPRKYVLGSWYSRWWPYTSDEYKQIVKEYHEHDFPLDMLVMDMDWHKKDAWGGYSWNRALFPHPEDYLKWIHDQGLHATLNDHPDSSVGAYEDNYASFMTAMGKDPSKKEVLKYNGGDRKFVTNVFKFMHEPLEKMGVDFWWLDWMGDDNFTFNRFDWINEFYYRHSRHDNLRGQAFSRWSDWGDQRHPIHFSGDTHVGWPTLQFEVPFTATSSNVGCFYWSHDMGGFEGRRNGELLARWVQFGAFSAALRLHSVNKATLDKRPWTYSRQVEDSMRIAFHLRSEFLPYTYSSAWEAYDSATPLLRPLYYEFPDVKEAYENSQEYFYGDAVLVAPITTPGKGLRKTASQKVWFPPGIWYDLFNGAAYQGGTTKTFADDINTFPVFAKGGTPIPLQPYTERMTTDALKTLVVRAYPGADGAEGSYDLYEDDGVTESYMSGAHALTHLTYDRKGATSSITIAPAIGSYAGQLAKRSYVVEFASVAKPARATVDGQQATLTYDTQSGVARVTVPPRDIRQATVVQITN